jgi:molybdopterin-guanine dinucleotide biosynthesis protein A
MGSDKALLEIGGIPLVLRVAGEIGKVCGSVTLVGNPSLYSGLGLPVVADEFAGEGPLSGIEAALGAADCDWNLITACDMPALEPAVLELLFREAGDGRGDGAVPRYGNGQIEPLCAVYHRRCHAAIRGALEAGVRKVTDALSTLALTYIPVTAGEPFANLNTPEDLRKYTNG